MNRCWHSHMKLGYHYLVQFPKLQPASDPPQIRIYIWRNGTSNVQVIRQL